MPPSSTPYRRFRSWRAPNPKFQRFPERLGEGDADGEGVRAVDGHVVEDRPGLVVVDDVELAGIREVELAGVVGALGELLEVIQREVQLVEVEGLFEVNFPVLGDNRRDRLCTRCWQSADR